MNNSPPSLEQALLRHRFSLKKAWQRAQRVDGEQQRRLLERFRQQLADSIALREARLAIPLDIRFPEELPVSQQREAIARLIEQHPVVIVAGETGSGKTTQLAKLCLQLGRGREGMIAHTQPRRIAATSVAARIAEELQVTLGNEVGCQVRFHDNSSDRTLLKLMTDGVLLAEIARDPLLQAYDTLIVDEAHERSLNIDFLLGYIKRILPRRPDLKVVITSATIDVERFAAFFGQAPVVSVSGRSYPVDMVYYPPAEGQGLAEAVLAALQDIDRQERCTPAAPQRGDVLVFLPGEQDIRACSLLLRKSVQLDADVLPLYARLPAGEQQKIFAPASQRSLRRVILATNVAETSLTVPGIRYVIDSGLARISRYSYRAKVQRLPVEKVARANADQRAGRCGRVGPGICYRLYDEADYLARAPFGEPEILRSNLSSVILQMLSLGLGDIARFEFLQPPDQRLINDGLRQLRDLGALDGDRLTASGRQMAALPLEPSLARILLAADKHRCLREMLVIVAALSIADPRETPADKRDAAREKHRLFREEQSDFLGYLRLFATGEQQRQQLGHNQFRKWCQQHFLNAQRMREWRDIHHQLASSCRQLGLRENREDADYAAIHQALLAGLVTHVGCLDQQRRYQGTRNRHFRLFHGSALANKPPKWVVAAELLETSQLYAHCAARIDPEWIFPAAQHLLKFHYHEPHWQARQGQVVALRQASLYGLVIEERRPVSYGSINPAEAREIFIREALVEEKLKTRAPFFSHNRELRRAAEKLEEKSRRRDILCSDDAVFDFYQQRIPAHIHNAAAFEQWRQQAEREQPRLLFAPRSLFVMQDMAGTVEARFPDHCQWQDMRYRLRYRFEPGAIDDGVSVDVPLAALNRVPRFLFDWLVPGLLAEKIEALLRSLPKSLRKPLVPLPDTAAELAALLQPADQPLTAALSDALAQHRNISVPLAAWQPDRLDNYYKANFRLLGDDGKLLAQSRDLASLLAGHAVEAQQALAEKAGQSQPAMPPRTPYTSWTFTDLQPHSQFRQGGTTVTAYPALQDDGDAVSIVWLDYPHKQAAVHRKGLIRLAMLALAQQSKYLRKELLKGNALQLKLSAEFDRKLLLEDLLCATFAMTFFADTAVFSRACFEQLLAQNKGQLINNAQQLERLLRDIIEADYQVRLWLDRMAADAALKPFVDDVRRQRAALLPSHFIDETALHRLQHFPRYLAAMQQRLERLPGQLAKNREAMAQLERHRQRLAELFERHPDSIGLARVEDYRWQLEEFRVSLFAQQLKTPQPVSAKRLDALWQAIEDDIQRNFL